MEIEKEEMDRLKAYFEAIREETRVEEEGKKAAESFLRVLSTLGMSIAVVVSWSANHSILWAMLHGLLSWIYLIYYTLRYITFA